VKSFGRAIKERNSKEMRRTKNKKKLHKRERTVTNGE
jgi:hypothetical protein